MRTVNYSELLRGTAALCGFVKGDDDTGDLDASTFDVLRSFHDDRLRTAWECNDWPELMRTEKRYFRPFYSATDTYAAPTATSADERFYPPTGKYYQSLQAGNIGHTPANADNTANWPYWTESAASYSGDLWATGTVYAVGTNVRNPADDRFYICIVAHTAGASFDAAKFAILTPFNRYVAYAQTGATVIGELFSATEADPRITTRLCQFPFIPSADGFQFAANAPTSLYLYFRLRRPELRGAPFDVETVYTSGQQIYYTASTGVENFYDVVTDTTAGQTPESTAAKFALVEIPYLFQSYLIKGGYADWLTQDEQETRANKWEMMAQSALEKEADKLHRQQGQTKRLNFHRR